MKGTHRMLNRALLVSFLVTCLAPLTGVHVHKLASVLFLLLCAVHAVVCRRRLGRKLVLLLGAVALSFATGVAGMILDQYPIFLRLHRVISLAVTAFLAIHVFVCRKRL